MMRLMDVWLGGFQGSSGDAGKWEGLCSVRRREGRVSGPF